ncbi:hypothetical protein NliqN6_2693 [Naganishia liquefaciens]|uniref:alpha-amylase n=1 Tax=Naganishia liquefaciens TaxID=104408 RepID=A0A8H3YG13_9TREE|nr:hypothetical protein NliqN6_2693 [Naganishia liquefaciens]
MLLLRYLWLCLQAFRLAYALDTDGWRRQTIYQLLTDRFAREDELDAPCNLPERQYCGGNWKGLINKLDYIQGMGFTAIWISPVVENEDGGYHGYYTLDHDKLNSNFGTREDLQTLSSALHARGMYLMVDVVVNHVGSPRNQVFHPDDRYGLLNQPEDYHPHCWIRNYDNQTEVEQCWIGEDQREALVDVNTESPKVVREMYRWIRQLVADYDIDGLRVDTVKHVRKSFWPAFEEAAGVFCTGEVLHGGRQLLALASLRSAHHSLDAIDPAYTYAYQGAVLSSVHNFPLFFPLRRAFSSPEAEIIELTDMMLRAQSEAKDVSTLTTFLEQAKMPQPDLQVPRFAHNVADDSLRMNALAFPFLADGIPIMYSGGEQVYEGGDDPYNREPMWQARWSAKNNLYDFVSRVVAARNTALNANSDYALAPSVPIVTTDHEIVILRAPLLSVLSNRGLTAAATIVAFTVPQFKPGTILVDIVPQADIDDSVNHVMVGIGGSIRVRLTKGLPRIFLPYDLAKVHQNLCVKNAQYVARTEEALATAFQQSVILRSPQSRPRRSLKQSISELWRSPKKPRARFTPAWSLRPSVLLEALKQRMFARDVWTKSLIYPLLG